MSRAETHQAAQTVVDAQLPEKPQSLRKPRSGQIRLCWSTPRTAPSHAGPELILARNSLDQLEARLREVYAFRRDKTPFVSGAPSLHYGAIVGALDAAKGAGRRPRRHHHRRPAQGRCCRTEVIAGTKKEPRRP